MDVGLVCDACHALTPFGVTTCVRCSAPVALESGDKPQATPAAISSGVVGRDDQPCPKCNALVSPQHKFCFHCGARMPEQFAFEETRIRKLAPLQRGTNVFSATPNGRAKLTLIRGDGEDGIAFALAGEEHVAGRDDCHICFADDPYVSPIHCTFLYRGTQLIVRDEHAANGVFVRLSEPVPLTAHTQFLVGEQVLSARCVAKLEDVAESDGTYYSASMPRPAKIELHQHLRGGLVGRVQRFDTDQVTIGREQNLVNFGDDPFISGRHAEVQLVNGQLILRDVGSRNGTFLRIAGEHVLKHGDFVFVGQQLLRVEIL